MHTKPAITQTPIHSLLQDRWSPRAFDPKRTLSDTDLQALLEAARWSPSCFNDQPWRFVVFVKEHDENQWQLALNCLAAKNQLWAQHAPVLVLTVASENFQHNGAANRWASYDTGAASLSLCLQATALGLVTHQMGGFDAQQARALVNLPTGYTPMAMIAVGYQAEIDTLAEEFKAAESAERIRASLEDRFYFGLWGKSEKG